MIGSASTADDCIAQQLDATGRFRVLRRFEPPVRYADPATRSSSAQALKVGLFVDLETTGLDTQSCSVIEFGAVQFSFDHETGAIYEIVRTVSALEDPGFPIPPEITEITGITDADLQGRKIDDDAVAELVNSSDLAIAFNAEFDRPVAERRFPLFMDKHWACAMSEIPWAKFGARGKKHDYLLVEVLRQFHDAHRAVDDCQAGVHLLATPRYVPRETDPCACLADAVAPSSDCIRHGEDRSPFDYLLDSVRTPKHRVWALGAPYGRKEALKAKKYRWSPGDDGRRKGWWKDIPKDGVDAETAWLLAEIYQAPRANIFVAKISARDRYSVRA